MSYDSSNSGSSQRSFLKRVLRSDQNAKATQSNVNTRHPGFKVSVDKSVPGNPLRPEVVMSSAVRQVNREGFVVYNVPESQEVYITMPSEEAFFDDEEPKMVHMQPNSFVGSNQTRSTEANTLPKFANVVRNNAEITQAADMFSNARRREALDDIDYSEIIIKSNDDFEKEIEESEAFMQRVVPSSRAESPTSTISVAGRSSPITVTRPVRAFDGEKVQEARAEVSVVAKPEVINAPMEEPMMVEASAPMFVEAPIEEPVIVSTRFSSFVEAPVEESDIFIIPVEEPMGMEVPVSRFVEEPEVTEMYSGSFVEASVTEPEVTDMFSVPVEEPMEMEVPVSRFVEEPEVTEMYAGSFVEEPVAEQNMFSEETVEEETFTAPVAAFSEFAPIEEISTQMPVSEFANMMDIVPSGLYVEGSEPVSEAIINADADEDMSSFLNTANMSEIALTSEAAPQPIEWDSGTFVPEYTTSSEEVFDATNIGAEVTEATPLVIVEIEDPVADMLKLTIPALYEGEEYIDNINDIDATYPDDGLEGHDAIFISIKSVSVPISTSETSALRINVREEISNTLSLNFRS